MRFYILLVFTVIILNSCQTDDKPDFDLTGKWELKKETAEESFTLNLIQKDSKIAGDYCAIAYSGEFIDCWLEDDYDTLPIQGHFSQDTFRLVYNIAYTGGKANASITLDQNKTELKWILKSSSEVTYCPDSATLVKIIK